MRRSYFFYGGGAASGHSFRLKRPHMLRLLENAVQKRLVVVVAGAGYGKTEAVYSFLKHYGVSTTWIQLSQRDNQVTRFWENFLHAVSQKNRPFARKLAEIGFPETESEYDRYLPLPEDEIAPNTKYIFVFDDFHLIEEPKVLRFMERSINANFSNITTILISRKEPPINIVEMLARGMVSRIDEDDLRFTENETAGYFQLQGVKLSPQDAFDIYKATEGWAFAISLVWLALTKKPGHKGCGYALSAMKQNTFKLIESEVFSGMEEDLRNFLIRLSLIDHLSLDLVKTLSPNTRFVEELSKLSSFIRYDVYLNAYRIHHLFLDYLSQRQHLLTEDEKRKVYAKAIRWCVENGYKMDAVTYCEKISDYEKIIEIVYTLQMSLPPGVAQFLLEVFERIPGEHYERNGTLYIIRMRLLLALERFSEVTALRDAVLEKYEPLPDTPFKCRILCGVYNIVGLMHCLRCEREHDYEFWRCFEKSARYHAQSGYTVKGPVTVLSVSAYACRVGSEEKGHIEKFLEAVEKSIPHLSVTMNGTMYGLDDLIRAEAAYYKADMKNCEKFAYQTLRKAQEKGQHEIENRALYFLLRAALSAGNYPAVQELCEQLERQLQRPNYINRHTLYDIVMGWYYVTIRHSGQMAQWLKSDFHQSDFSPFMHGLENAVKARYYLHEKRYHALLAFIESQSADHGMGVFLYGKVGLKVYESICRYHLGERDNAMETLADAYRLALPNGLDMPFIEQAGDMRALAGAAIKYRRENGNYGVPLEWLENIRKKSATYAKRLAHIISEHQKAHQLEGGVRFTVRETELLTDLSRGLSRTEIAAGRNLSINTVKAALQMIYIKLGAENGADAVRIAASLNLLK